jgi:hypothetical protein
MSRLLKAPVITGILDLIEMTTAVSPNMMVKSPPDNPSVSRR